jgi:hypothetical protein
MNAVSTPSIMSTFSSGYESQPEKATQPSLEATASVQQLQQFISQAFQEAVKTRPVGLEIVAERIAKEVVRICEMSDRIQASGRVDSWQRSLAQHRLDKYLHYYRQGSRRGRVDLHSTLSSIVYRYIAPTGSQLGFQGRYSLLEDFLQNFYIEVLKAFRREHNLPADYTPRTRLELAEYMAFTEQYAKRRINLRGRQSQQLVVLRAQAFAKRQPAESSVDMALVADSAKTEEGEAHARSSTVQQVREQMVADAEDPTDGVIRDRIIRTLIDYLESQNQPECIDYLVLKLQDCAASEIDEILQLTPRQRDYLQQRFKYHVEKFAQIHHWELVHQWLGTGIDKRFGLTQEEWGNFIAELSPEERHLVALKQQEEAGSLASDQEIAQTIGWTVKKVQRTWGKILSTASKYRNQA